jgi:hypothetical protein
MDKSCEYGEEEKKPRRKSAPEHSTNKSHDKFLHKVTNFNNEDYEAYNTPT